MKISDQLPSDFEWVKARSECSISVMFEHLKIDAKRNMADRVGMNDAFTKEFKFTSMINGSRFAIIRDSDIDPDVDVAHKVVSFWMKTDCIVVKDKSDVELFSANLTLNNDGQCRFKVDGAELDRWQLLRRALEPIFFER